MIKINLFWTGGLDSTCRVIELSRKNVVLQPYYIKDSTRGSTKYELKAIKKIAKEILSHKDNKFQLLPLIVIEDKTIVKNDEIHKSWELLNKKYKLGQQYEYLANFAKNNNLKLELGFEKAINDTISRVFKGEGELKTLDDNNYEALYVDTEKSSKELIDIFGNLLISLPIWGFTKLQEAEEIKALGFEKCIKMTWFCHFPIFGRPCGVCNPCNGVIEYGMSYRLVKFSLWLHEQKKKNNFFWKIAIFLLVNRVNINNGFKKFIKSF
jgi:7-cyano-7-deazaguanine synthase in queuosine biosynthesis